MYHPINGGFFTVLAISVFALSACGLKAASLLKGTVNNEPVVREPDPVTAKKFVCEEGTELKVSPGGSRYCAFEINQTWRVTGPFPKEMHRRCKTQKGGALCDLSSFEKTEDKSWPLEIAFLARGSDKCPAGTFLVSETFCSDGELVYGPFTQDHILACEEGYKGKDECKKMVWDLAKIPLLKKAVKVVEIFLEVDWGKQILPKVVNRHGLSWTGDSVDSGCAGTVSEVLLSAGYTIKAQAYTTNLVKELVNAGWKRHPISQRASIDKYPFVVIVTESHNWEGAPEHVYIARGCVENSCNHIHMRDNNVGGQEHVRNVVGSGRTPGESFLTPPGSK